MLLHIGEDMAVDVEGYADGGVAQHFTHYEWLDTFQEQQGRRSVPKIMWSDIRQLRLLDHRDVLLFAEVGLRVGRAG